jgi:hypothetical protein
MTGVRPFTKSYLDVLESDAWHYLGINARRFVDFLVIENMRRGGKQNGRLLAPRQQLEEFGIGARHISTAIDDVMRVGLVDCRRGVGRQPSLYTLTWLPLSDGTLPSDRWRSYSIASEGKSQSQFMTSEGKSLGYPKGSHKARSDFPSEAATARSDFPSDTARREAPYKMRSYQEEQLGFVLEGRGVGEGVSSGKVTHREVH